MSPLAVFLLSFIVLFVLGMPIAAAMIVSSFTYGLYTGMGLEIMGTKMFTGLNNFALVAIPLFILTAEVMNRTSVADRIFKFCKDMVGYIPGGMGHVNITTSIVFAGMSGSAVADAGGIGHLAYKAMLDEGFDDGFSAATTVASSTVGPIIPPSIPAVVYAMVANVSVGKLLFGGIIPGLVMGIILMAYVYLYAIRHHVPSLEWEGWRHYVVSVVKSFINCFLPLLTPVILLGGIYMGVVTTTEAAALAVLYAVILGAVIYRTMSIKDFCQSLVNVVIASGSVLLVVPAAKCFSFVMTAENLQTELYDIMTVVSGGGKFGTAVVITVLFLVLGCLSDPNINIMVFLPMVLPMIKAAGFDPIHAGICIIVIAMIGNITPPVGVVLMTTCSLEHISMEKVCKKLWPFLIVLMSEVALLWSFPALITWLPNLLMKR